VGSSLGTTYEPALRAFISELDLDDAVSLAGSVSEAELEAYYRAADVFVCASEHEGFCVPLAEAMGHGVPIVAYGVTAVPETVRDAGLLLEDKSPGMFAAAVSRVLGDTGLARSLSQAGRARVEAFDRPSAQREMVSLLRRAVGV
jgi:glycosyltransferase involved in cell wall biosynthesis